MRTVLVGLTVGLSVALLLAAVAACSNSTATPFNQIREPASAIAAPNQAIRFSQLATRYVYSRWDLMNVVRTSDGTFWAAGYDGHDPNRLFKSRDGLDWEIVPVKTGDWVLYDLALSDDSNFWAVGNYGTVVHSPDGGATFEQKPKPVHSNLNRIMFASPRVGYIAGSKWRHVSPGNNVGPMAFLLRTDDGGSTWHSAYRSRDASGDVFSIAPFSELGALVSVGGQLLIRTDDGGRTWKEVGTAEMRPLDVRCLPSGVCWAVGPNGFFRSGDAGLTWSRVVASPDVLSGRYWWSIDFTDENVGIAVGDRGACVLTTDGGRTWAQVPNPPECVFGADHLRSIKLYGSFGLILGGQSLYRIELPFVETKAARSYTNAG